MDELRKLIHKIRHGRDIGMAEGEWYAQLAKMMEVFVEQAHADCSGYYSHDVIMGKLVMDLIDPQE
jgi:hypothetical protein